MSCPAPTAGGEARERALWPRAGAMMVRHGTAFLVVAAFLVSGLLTLPAFGVAWDEGLGNLFFGQRYLRYLTTLDRAYLDFARRLPADDAAGLRISESPMRDRPHEFPPVADVVSAASMELLGRRLRWLDPVDAFHLSAVLLASAMLVAVYRFAARRLGLTAAYVALVALGTFPRLWGDMHFNVKDVPVAALLCFAVLAYVSWFERPGWGRACLAGALGGLALGVKANAAFLPLVLALGLWSGPRLARPGSWPRRVARLAGHHLAMLAVAAAVYVAAWPYLYARPARVLEHVRYVVSQGDRPGADGFNVEPALMVLATMPEATLALWLGGVAALAWLGAAAFRGARRGGAAVVPPGSASAEELQWGRLLLAWCFVPIARASLPGTASFDGVRHFLEFLPAAALLAGWGAQRLCARAERRVPRSGRLAAVAIVGAVALPGVVGIARYWPAPHVYFNHLTALAGGAERLFGPSETSDYWATSYRLGMEWLNAAAEPDARLVVPVAGWLARISGPRWLRPDIDVVADRDLRAALGGGRPVYVMFVTRPEFYTDLARWCVATRQPVHRLEVVGRPILLVFRLGPHTLPAVGPAGQA